MQKRGSFEQQVELVKSGRGRVAAGDALDATEEIGD